MSMKDTENFSKKTKKIYLLAMSGNGSKPISAEPITAQKRESLKIRKRKSQKL